MNIAIVVPLQTRQRVQTLVPCILEDGGSRLSNYLPSTEDRGTSFGAIQAMAVWSKTKATARAKALS